MQIRTKNFRLTPLCLALGLVAFSTIDAATRADFHAQWLFGNSRGMNLIKKQ